MYGRRTRLGNARLPFYLMLYHQFREEVPFCSRRSICADTHVVGEAVKGEMLLKRA